MNGLKNKDDMVEDFSPLKVIKFCPQCGSSKFSPDSFKSFRCTDCGFSYYINSATAVAAIIFDSKERVLLTVRKFPPAKGMLDLPGGFVDPLETAEDALMREIKEELNLEINIERFVQSQPNKYVFSGMIVYTTDLFFACSVKDFSSIKTNEDVSGFVFKHPSDINLSEIGLDSIRKVLETLKNGRF